MDREHCRCMPLFASSIMYASCGQAKFLIEGCADSLEVKAGVPPFGPVAARRCTIKPRGYGNDTT
eukprot:1160208-Pelagomonas_calceolata.AAC.6